MSNAAESEVDEQLTQRERVARAAERHAGTDLGETLQNVLESMEAEDD